MSVRFMAALWTAVVVMAGGVAMGQTNMTTLLTNGPTSIRLNIVFFSEGYTIADLSHFESDARVMLNRMLGTPPLKEYSSYFNAFCISVPSKQSGSDHYTPTTNLVDTFFDSRFDTSGVKRLLTISTTGRNRVNALLAQFMPEYDLAAVVVNDAQYGGSGGSILVASINGASAEVAIHEMGHTFAGLGDEYSDAGGTPRERPNTTQQTNLASIKWNAWIPTGTPIPTPDTSAYNNVVGLFRGAVYSTNYFRPKRTCMMQTLGVPFCEVCSETLIKTIYNKLGMIESYLPATNNVLKSTNDLAITFSLTTLSPATHSLNFQWFTNNVAVVGATSSVFSVGGFNLSLSGTNLIRADVADPTSLVRAAPTNMMMTSLSWKSSFVPLNPQVFVGANALRQSTLSWPITAAGLYLEHTDDLVIGTWMPIMLISNQPSYIFLPIGQQGFYRLHR